MADANPLRILAMDGNPISFNPDRAILLGDLRTCLAEMWDVSSHNVKLVSDGGAVLFEDEHTLDSMTGDITAVRISRLPWTLEPVEFSWGSYDTDAPQHPDKDFIERLFCESRTGTTLWGAFTHVKATPRDLQPWEEFAAQEDNVQDFDDLAGAPCDLGSTRPIDVLWSLAFWGGSMHCSFGNLWPDDDATAMVSAKSAEGRPMTHCELLGGEVAKSSEKSFRLLLQLVEKRGSVGEVLIHDALPPTTEFVGRGSNDDDSFACFATAKYNYFMKYIRIG